MIDCHTHLTTTLPLMGLGQVLDDDDGFAFGLRFLERLKHEEILARLAVIMSIMLLDILLDDTTLLVVVSNEIIAKNIAYAYGFDFIF